MDGAVLTPDRSLRLLARPHPFQARIVDREVQAGATIHDLVLATGFDSNLLGHVVVFLTDRTMQADPWPVPRKNWHRVRPKPGTVVSIHVAPGKGGGKSPIATVLSIAVMVAAAAYGGALGGAILKGLGTASAELFTIGSLTVTTGGLLGGGIISIAGPMLIAAEAPPA